MPHFETSPNLFKMRANPYVHEKSSILWRRLGPFPENFLQEVFELTIKAYGPLGLQEMYNSERQAQSSIIPRLKGLLSGNPPFADDVWLGFDENEGGSDEGPFDSLMIVKAFESDFVMTILNNMYLPFITDVPRSEIINAKRVIREALGRYSLAYTIVDRMRLDTQSAKENMRSMTQEFFEMLRGEDALYFTSCRTNTAYPMYRKLAQEGRFLMLIDLPIRLPVAPNAEMRFVIGTFENY